MAKFSGGHRVFVVPPFASKSPPWFQSDSSDIEVTAESCPILCLKIFVTRPLS